MINGARERRHGRSVQGIGPKAQGHEDDPRLRRFQQAVLTDDSGDAVQRESAGDEVTRAISSAKDGDVRGASRACSPGRQVPDHHGFVGEELANAIRQRHGALLVGPSAGNVLLEKPAFDDGAET